ncbi:efflux RND transporter periplasmic adaptor subunit [Plastoroseomonas arctica]|uniref:Efflux RND transporter periplasmic adaptor subunit n=1 Tax=Plastoroseomonas arctica TaxID=1509237 RepID=A0AAF1K2X7_9PROT|nr:efflux RND transporter periplasmic adaptor subunit [Plastoroseomonas arctica]MBR0655446.1 efflux RND transporter periplasmic adaptor subunit [Plastoroseomonas arctica]
MNSVSPKSAMSEVEILTPIAPPAPPVPPRRRKRLLGVAVVLALGAGAGAYWWLTQRAPTAEAVPVTGAATGRLTDGSFRLPPAQARLLRIEPVGRRDFRPERVAEGRISYNEDRSTPVFAPYTGRVLRAVAQPGQQVQAGEVLFEIETTDLTQAANDLLGALDGTGRARTQLTLATRNLARQRELFAARAAARRELEQAEADLANAEGDLRTAEASLAAARDRLRVLGRDPAAIAEIERTRRVNAVVSVVAPLAGTVVQRRIGPNQWLGAGGSDPVYTIADLSDVWLVAGVRELDAPLVRIGQEIEVTVSALPGRTFAARIEHVGAALDPTTRRLAIRAAVQDPEHLLKPEMFAAFRIAVGDARNAVAVPASALIHRGAQVSLWEAIDDTRFILRSVRVGPQIGGYVQVTEGLEDGARVVSGGALFIDRAAQD